MIREYKRQGTIGFGGFLLLYFASLILPLIAPSADKITKISLFIAGVFYFWGYFWFLRAKGHGKKVWGLVLILLGVIANFQILLPSLFYLSFLPDKYLTREKSFRKKIKNDLVFKMEDSVPPTHPMRKLRNILNYDFIFQILQQKTKLDQSLPVSKLVLIKMIILLLLYDVQSETELLAEMPDRLDWRWFLGYESDELIPKQAVISEVRKILGNEKFRDVFTTTLGLLKKVGSSNIRKPFTDSFFKKYMKFNVVPLGLLQLSGETFDCLYSDFLSRLAINNPDNLRSP
jgi:transposase